MYKFVQRKSILFFRLASSVLEKPFTITNMDQSLAKGLKNYFLNEIDIELTNVSAKFMKISKENKLGIKRSQWDRYCEQINKVFGDYLITKLSGGTKRKPFYGLYTLDINNDKKYSSWNERCLNSAQLLINLDPWHVEHCPAGFNISEHAIQRIYQRTFSTGELEAKDKIKPILKELVYAPLWSAYWTQAAFTAFTKYKINIIYPFIPTPSGILLGEMTLENIHKVEIRTYVSDDLLSKNQKLLKELMLGISEEFKKNSLEFFPILDIVGIQSSEYEFEKIKKAINFDELLFNNKALIQENLLLLTPKI